MLFRSSGEKSRFITQLLSEYSATTIRECVYKGEQLQLKNNNEITIKNTGMEDAISSWAKKGVSPSALNTYSNCSLSFYYHYLAKIKKDDEVDEFADASHLGTAVHSALDEVYEKGILNENLIEDWKPKILKQIIKEYRAILKNNNLEEIGRASCRERV